MATKSPVLPNETSSSNSTKQLRKPRVVRRRGPVRADDLDDEPIERAPLSDSESEHSDDSATEDEEDEVEPSPPAPIPLLDGASTTTPETSDPPSKESSHLWSDSVALDKAAGEDLPVIDFADLALVVEGDPDVKAPSTGEKDVITPTAAPGSAVGDSPAPGPPKSRPVPAHIIARSAYLEKLNNDPSFIPRVGLFWGHDDRLMDKEMRPMSDWWRGRWQNRGGRGGRGGFVGRGGRGGRPAESMDGPPPENQDPIDRKWEHDAYDDGKKGEGGARRGSNTSKGWYKEKSGARGGFKGGRGGSTSGSTVNAADIQARLQAEAAAKIASERGNSPVPTPTGMRPPKKAARPQANQRAKVKALLGQAAKENSTANAQSVVAAVKNEVAAEKAQTPTTSAEVAVTQPSGIKVNLPKSPARRRPPPPLPTIADIAPGDKRRLDGDLPNGNRRPSGKGRSQGLEKAVLKDSFTKPAATSNPPSDAGPSPATSQPPVVVNAPVDVQPSANPKYSYLTLPPGLAMGDSGILYEIASGRPVVLNPPGAPTPPLPAPPMHIYNPRAVAHPRPGSMSYIPPHVLSGLHPQTPPTPPHPYIPQGGAPYANGSPVLHEPQPGVSRPPTFFTPPRSGQRVQIRPPASGSNGVKLESTKDTPITQPPPSYGSMPAPEQYAGYTQPPAMNGQYYGGPQAVDPYYGTTYYSTPPGVNGAQPPFQSPQTDDSYYGGATYYQQTPYRYPPQTTDYGYNASSVGPRNEAGSNGGYGFDGVPAADGQQPQQMYY